MNRVVVGDNYNPSGNNSGTNTGPYLKLKNSSNNTANITENNSR